jgi:lipopolysaccharide export LptBFGC system permease protein LptF
VDQRKIILWSIALFFGCSILFRAIDSAVGEGKTTLSLAIQLGVLVAIVVAIVLISRRRKK